MVFESENQKWFSKVIQGRSSHNWSTAADHYKESILDSDLIIAQNFKSW